MHQEHQGPRFLLIKPQPVGGLFGKRPSNLAMILLPSFPEVMQQNRQVEEILAPDLLVHLTEDPLLLRQRLRFRHRQQAVLVHRVLVVLIELHQAPDRREHRDELFQEMRPVHRLESAGH